MMKIYNLSKRHIAVIVFLIVSFLLMGHENVLASNVTTPQMILDTLDNTFEFDVAEYPCWYHSPDGSSRKLCLDFMETILNEPVEVRIVTPLGTFNQTVNTEAQPVDHVDLLVPMPYSTESEPVSITLATSTETSTGNFMILPERKWEVYLVHQTHLDIGYTNTQPNVMDMQVNYIYNALRYIDQSDSLPEEETFKWHPEGMWAVEEFLKTASLTDKIRFAQATRDGTIHLDALYAQAMTGIYSEEELFELIGSSKRYGEEYGINIISAMQTDVPGYTWGLVSALSHWGVKYINVGPNPGHRVGHTND